MIMRRLAATFLVLVYLTTFYKVAVPYVGYYANKDFIAAELCINQDKPELKCKGKCFLMQKLEDLASQEMPTNPLIPGKVSVEDLISTHLFSQDILLAAPVGPALRHFRYNFSLPMSPTLLPSSPPPRA